MMMKRIKVNHSLIMDYLLLLCLARIVHTAYNDTMSIINYNIKYYVWLYVLCISLMRRERVYPSLLIWSRGPRQIEHNTFIHHLQN